MKGIEAAIIVNKIHIDKKAEEMQSPQAIAMFRKEFEKIMESIFTLEKKSLNYTLRYKLPLAESALIG